MTANAIAPTSTARPPRTTAGFALLGTVQATLIFTLMAISVPLPDIGREFGLDHSDLVLLNAAYGLSFAALLLLGGRLTDRYGGRRVLTGGLVVLGLASAAAPFAPGFTALLLLRFLQGVGAALVAPAGMAVLRALLPSAAEYGRAMATWGGLSVLGATTGNLASGAVADWLSWRWMFVVPVIVTAAALVLAPRLLPADPPRERRPALDLPGAVLATAGTVLVSYGLVLTETGGWVPPFAAGLLLLVAFVLRERRAAEPLLPLGFLRGGRRLLGLGATLLSAGGTATVFLLMTLHLQQDLGWTPSPPPAPSSRTPPPCSPAAGSPGRSSAGSARGPSPSPGSPPARPASSPSPASTPTPPTCRACCPGCSCCPSAPPSPSPVRPCSPPTACPRRRSAWPAASSTPRWSSARPCSSPPCSRSGPADPPSARPRPSSPSPPWPAASPPAAADPPGRRGTRTTRAPRRPTPRHTRGPTPQPTARSPLPQPRPRSHSATRTEHRSTTMTSQRFAGRTALVTGGGSGLGRAIALAFAAEGAAVAVAGRTPATLAETAAMIRAAGGTAEAIATDTTDAVRTTALVADTVGRLGALDVAVNNAGILRGGRPFADQNPDDWRALLETNVLGTVLAMQAQISHMRAHGGGAIVNVSSNIGAHTRLPGLAGYAASKAAVSALTRAAALDHIRDGVRINAVSPGASDTAMSLRPGEGPTERAARMKEQSPLGRVSSTAEVAAAVLYLASADAASVVGTDLVVDGGASA